MICVSIGNKNLDLIYGILDSADVQMAEIRLDSCSLLLEEVEELFANIDKPLIATYRMTDVSQAAQAEAALSVAVRSGADYIDLDIEAPAMMCKRLRRQARECGTLLIRSFHDYEGTDSTRALSAVVDKCFHLGADVVKIATTAVSEGDVSKVMRLYESYDPQSLVAFCMGDAGSQSRIDCLKAGAPFCFACLLQSEQVAPGQIPLEQMRAIVYGGHEAVFDSIGSSAIETGCCKSYAQRAVILAALAEGESRIDGYTPCDDSESALSVAKAFGASVCRDGNTLTIRGTGGRIIGPAPCLSVGESGLLARLCIPVVAALGSGEATILGEKTLLSRPLSGAHDIMAAFGVDIDGESVPITVRGHLGDNLHGRPCVEIDGVGGSQLVSGLLTALPLCRNGCSLRLVNPKSIPYIFMTLDMMRRFGVNVDCEMEGGEEFADTQDWSLCEAMTFTLHGGSTYKGADITLESDWSTAANFMTAGAIFGRADIKGLDTKSLQADLSILDILPLAGASVSQEEESGIVHVVRGPLRGFELDASNCPDLVPIISVLAAFCGGRSTISGVARLSAKESNRPAVIVEMLGRMGVRAYLRGDKLQIDGRSLESRILSGRLLRGGTFSAHGDHRIAMALAVASLGAESPLTIEGKDCVNKSFPAFFDVFNVFTGHAL